MAGGLIRALLKRLSSEAHALAADGHTIWAENQLALPRLCTAAEATYCRKIASQFAQLVFCRRQSSAVGQALTEAFDPHSSRGFLQELAEGR